MKFQYVFVTVGKNIFIINCEFEVEIIIGRTGIKRVIPNVIYKRSRF